MSLLADYQIVKIIEMATSHQGNLLNWKPMIDPFISHQVSEVDGKKVISFGLSSSGYDIRVADEFKIFTTVPGMAGTAVDPKKFDPKLLVDFKGPVCEIPPHSYILCRSVEKFCIPKDISVTCLGKSTYARCGVHVNVTPLEPGWSGILTIELSNAGPSPVKIYANEGIAQLMFHKLQGPARIDYKSRGGKYQDQDGIVPPRMKE